MKRYFDIAESRLTLQLNVTLEGMKYTVTQLEKKLNIKGLREINRAEFNKLSKEYTS
jgi:hypothetical protein